MAEYINANDLEDFRNELMREFLSLCNYNDYSKITLLTIGETIDRIYNNYYSKPLADVVEVLHGECIICSGRKDITQDCDNGYYIEVDREQCDMSVWFGDECLAVFSIDFCPNCGAKMDGKGEGE